jgi:hypothetical protein
LSFAVNRVKALKTRYAERKRALWSRRLAYQMTKLPKFEDVFRAVRRSLRQTDLP